MHPAIKLRIHSPRAVERLLRTMSAALRSEVPQGILLSLGPLDVKPEELAARLDQLAAIYKAESDNKVEGKKLLAQRRAAEPTILDLVSRIATALEARLGAENPDLSKFGIAPARTRRKLDSEQLAARAGKARATRASHDAASEPGKEATPSP